MFFFMFMHVAGNEFTTAILDLILLMNLLLLNTTFAYLSTPLHTELNPEHQKQKLSCCSQAIETM